MTANSPAVPSSRAGLPVVMWMIVFISIETLSREISGSLRPAALAREISPLRFAAVEMTRDGQLW